MLRRTVNLARRVQLQRLNVLGSRNFAVKTLESEEQYDKLSKSADGTTIFYFTASWCGPCRMIKPKFEELSEENPATNFVLVDIDEHDELAGERQIRGVPTFEKWEKGELVG